MELKCDNSEDERLHIPHHTTVKLSHQCTVARRCVTRSMTSGVQSRLRQGLRQLQTKARFSRTTRIRLLLSIYGHHLCNWVNQNRGLPIRV